MPFATTLAQAAGQAEDNMTVWFAFNQLKVRLQAFAGQLFNLFPDDNQNSRPVANWLTVLIGVVQPMSNSMTEVQLADTSQIMYRLLWMASDLQSSSLITTAQANAVLTAYNGQIGNP